MTQDRIIFLVIILSAIAFSFTFDFPNELANLLVATAILGHESYEYFKFRELRNSKTIFRIKSYEWLAGLGFTGFVLYWFSDEPMNPWNIIAIIEALIFTGIYSIRNWSLTYTIENEGIRNLYNGKLLDVNTITKIKINNEKLVIDTTEYQNDLIVKSSDLKSPSWEELKKELAKLK